MSVNLFVNFALFLRWIDYKLSHFYLHSWCFYAFILHYPKIIYFILFYHYTQLLYDIQYVFCKIAIVIQKNNANTPDRMRILPKVYSYYNTKRATTDFISIYCDSLTIQSDFTVLHFRCSSLLCCPYPAATSPALF